LARVKKRPLPMNQDGALAALGLDLGFDQAVLAEMFATLSRFADDELPLPDTQRNAMRDFFAEWGAQLRGGLTA